MDLEIIELIELAINTSATDIHFNFNSTNETVFFRTLNGFISLDISMNPTLLYGRLKYFAKLDIASTGHPQSGVFSVIVHDKEYYCRFSAIETFNQKSGVLRILNLSKINCLSDIVKGNTRQKILKLINQRTGLILIAGATGSGKSTTLFTLLKEIKDKSIFTLEDPIEQLVDKIMQIQVNERTNLNFNQGIKQLLRHDPDIIVIGEIRSEQEAQAAIRCSYSGHLVISTIHSSSAKGTLSRMIDFNIKNSDIEQLNIGIIYQQLLTNKEKRYAKIEVLDFEEVKKLL